jgi:hypothetical protein
LCSSRSKYFLKVWWWLRKSLSLIDRLLTLLILPFFDTRFDMNFKALRSEFPPTACIYILWKIRFLPNVADERLWLHKGFHLACSFHGAAACHREVMALWLVITESRLSWICFW